MRIRTNVADNEMRMMDANALCAYMSMGRMNAVKFAKEAGAEKRIGKRCLYDKRILDKALDELEE